ncbi:hypothetical protein BDZ45DRAFT_269157 [Acephala macrosclerotiorum]|nr:hypothetical protein BDZ45DRAFT_269157 [Acephala macrosclerotiorum]
MFAKARNLSGKRVSALTLPGKPLARPQVSSSANPIICDRTSSHSFRTIFSLFTSPLHIIVYIFISLIYENTMSRKPGNPEYRSYLSPLLPQGQCFLLHLGPGQTETSISQ